MSNTYTAGLASNVDSFNPPPPNSPAPTTPGPLYFYFIVITYEGAAVELALSQSTAPKKAKRPSKGKLELDLPFEQRDIDKPANGPKAAVVFRAQPLPGAVVRVEVKIDGVARPLEDFDFSPQLNAGRVTLALRHDAPPRLSVAINTTFVAKPATTGNFASPDAAAIKEILKHIHDRLLDGVESAWLGSDGAPDLAYQGSQVTAEQRWAKGITEMLLMSPYGLPLTAYSAPGLGDKWAVEDTEVMAKYFDPVDPVHSINYECQHLVTMAAMTRGMIGTKPGTNKAGEQVPVLTEMFTAGHGSISIPGRLGGSAIDVDGKDPTAKAVFDALFDTTPTKLTPSSSWVWNGTGNIPNSGEAHIGFALRVDATNRRIQTFDTGGLNVAGRDVPAIQNGGSYDDPWCSSLVPGPAGVGTPVYRGTCLMPEAKSLDASVDHMAKVRPLGFARLILIKRSDLGAPTRENILFASPLLRMHFGDQNLRFANYLWSLREHPGAANIAAYWMFFTIRGWVSRVQLYGDPDKPGSTRGLTLQQLLEAASRLETKNRKLTKPPDVPKPTSALDNAFPVADHTSRPDGSVLVERRWDQHGAGKYKGTQGDKTDPHAQLYDRLPWGTRLGAVALTDADFADLPYFTSG